MPAFRTYNDDMVLHAVDCLDHQCAPGRRRHRGRCGAYMPIVDMFAEDVMRDAKGRDGLKELRAYVWRHNKRISDDLADQIGEFYAACGVLH